MTVHRTTLSVLADLAEEQWGLFTRRQAEATGMAWSTLARLARTGAVERVAYGLYRLRGAPPVDNLDLRAAWLQLVPDVPVWERIPQTGVVSHRSAASVLGLGHLPADIHEFTLPGRRQSRRSDVRLHRALIDARWIADRAGLPVTTPARTAADLLGDREDPGAVAQIVADALRTEQERPANVVEAVAPYAQRYGLARADGLGLLGWLLDLTGETGGQRWLDEARGGLPEGG